MCTVERSAGGRQVHLVREYETGLPFQSLECGEWMTTIETSQKFSYPEFIRTHAAGLPAEVDAWGVHVLPLRPMWLGFFANTILYALWSGCLVAIVIALARPLFRLWKPRKTGQEPDVLSEGASA